MQWLTCTAQIKREDNEATDKPRSPNTGRAQVSCRGRTEKGQDLEIGGTVSYVREDRCVRGALTGKLAGPVVFEADLIGECGSGQSG